MPTPEKHQPLARFAESRDEAAFAQVVEEFGGLVFNGALRRTGDRQLAEEVAQNVFAITARKARKLARHPLLKAWLHTTTRLEASKALVSRRRYQRRIATHAAEMKSQADTTTEEQRENWREALPLLDASLDRLSPEDREILYGRFFQDQSFQELAEASGKSEAACKMRVKRALGKLNGWLSGRGVTLSVTALATGLAAEFSKAAPPAVASSLSCNALAASSSLSTATILTNTLNTMSTIKSTSLAAVAVLALGVIPVAMQQSQANHLKSELAGLQERATRLDSKRKPSIHDRDAGEDPGAVAADARPVARFLAALDRPVDADELIEQIVSAAMSRDMGRIMRVLLPVAKLSPAQGQQLLAEVQASKKSLQMRDMAMQMLSMMVNQPAVAPGEALDRNLGNGVDPRNLASNLREWAKQDPDAAIAWFESRRDAGTLVGKGVHESPQQHLLVGLVGGLSHADPDRAIALLQGVDAETRHEAIQGIAGTLVLEEASRPRALDLVRGIESPSDRARAAGLAASALARRDLLEAAAAFVHASNLDDESIATAIASAAIARGEDAPSRTWDQRVAWAIGNSPEAVRAKLVGELAHNGYHYYSPAEISRWIDAMPAGADRDAGLAAESGALSMNDQPVAALARAQAIGDHALRDDRIQRVFIWVNSRNAGAAEQLANDHGLKLEDILPR